VSQDQGETRPDPTLASTTTSEEDRKTAGQRQINRVWEYTQATIAVAVTLTTLWVCAALAMTGRGNEGAFLLLSNVFFLVVGTYFQRTNHTKGSSGENEEHR
jgi:hypothetical protein